LKRLRLDRIDVYQLHVPDPAVSFDASMEALAHLKEKGKIRHVALSNVTLEHIKRAQNIVPIVSVQNRYSFSDREWDFVVDYCEANGMAFLPWGPMAQGRKANEAVERIAATRKVSTAVVSLAWLLRRSPVILPIPGTSSVKHLEENVSAASFRLSDAEFAELAAVVPKPYWLRG
jgi:aryl-alcohol dehydrogenase-like predicted oxidoreductase